MMNQISTVERPRRREYSAEFKTSVLEQCRQPEASLADVALGYGINPKMVHRWIREDRQRLELIELQRSALAFVPLQLPPSTTVDQSLLKCVQANTDQVAVAEGIRVEIQLAGGKVTVTWPSELAGNCGAWLCGSGCDDPHRRTVADASTVLMYEEHRYASGEHTLKT